MIKRWFRSAWLSGMLPPRDQRVSRPHRPSPGRPGDPEAGSRHRHELPADWLSTCTTSEGCPRWRAGLSHHAYALRNIRALMCEAVQRKTCTVAELGAEITNTGRHGTALARRVLADLEAGCRSAPECEVRDLIMTSRILPEPRWNQPLPGARGIYPDACLPEARLVIEVDSRAFHGFGDAPERTERRRARYAALGWTVLPVAPRRVREEPALVLAEIEAAYLAGLDRRRGGRA